MVKVIALREFTYGNFNKITNLVRNDKEKKEHGRLYEKDTFECTEDMAKYLTGGCGYTLVKIIEVIPDKIVEEPKVETTSEEKPKETVKKTKRTKKK
jgi:hypothetical protein